MIDQVEFYLEDLKSKFSKIDKHHYYLSYSGGRDSHLLYWFIREVLKWDDLPVVSVNTYMEHPEILVRMKTHADVLLFPHVKLFELKAKHGIPCFSKIQDEMIRRYQSGSRSPSLMTFINGTKNGGKTFFKLNQTAKQRLLDGTLHKVSSDCCKYLKKRPLKQYEKETGKKAIMGIRGTESINRKAKYRTCFTKDGRFSPLFDLSDEIMKAIEVRHNIPIPKVYDHIRRTGCMGCPYGSHYGDTEKELSMLEGNQKKMICAYFKESLEVLGIDCNYKERPTLFDLNEMEDSK